MLGADTFDQGVTALALSQGHQDALVCCANHRISLPVTQTALGIHNSGTLLNTGAILYATSALSATGIALSVALLTAQVADQTGGALVSAQSVQLAGFAL